MFFGALTLIQVVLELRERQSIALFMSAIIFLVNLQALIGQVHRVVLFVEIVVCARGAQVPLPVEVNTEIVGDERPHADVELASLVQEGPLDVLLNDPELVLLYADHVGDVFHVLQHFNAAALVQRGWFDDPHVLLAVLEWHSFVATTPFLEFPESFVKANQVSLARLRGNNVSCRC